MSVLSIAEARAFLTSATPIPDSALQLAIDDLEGEIVSRFGPYFPTEVTELLSPAYGSTVLVLGRRIGSVVSVVETLAYAGSPVPTRTLDPADFRIRGYLLDRLGAGPNPAASWSTWGVAVTYVPVDDTNARKMAVVDALKVEVAHSGFASRRIGDYSESTSGGGGGKSDDVSTQRARILRRLRPKKIVLR